MPGMNGKVLSERLKESYPDLKVLLTSGYTADAFADRGVIDACDVLLHKPFAPDELAVKVREVLNGPGQPAFVS
jgi:DNA-binding NarL/FixJ family response regulator